MRGWVWLRHDGQTLPAIGFGPGELPVRVGDRVGVVFRPRLARWRGTERLELEVRALLPEGLKPPRTHGNSAFLDVCVAPCYQNTVPHLPRAVPCWTLKIAC